ncbi:MAG: hypothetical protein PHO32_06175 [Candidatus Cloacimonetes bacterium]|nr:hypothetical protein [Candidatus Cloacimonadota bacterium]
MKLVLAVLLLLLASCSSSRNQQVLNADEQQPAILITIQKGADSPFKQAIIAKLKEDYGTKYSILVKNIKGFHDVQDEKYDALIVMDQLKAWLFMNKGLKNIARKADKQKTIFFVSAGDPDWKWKREDLKLVTSATAKVNPDEVYARIKTRLDEVLVTK